MATNIKATQKWTQKTSGGLNVVLFDRKFSIGKMTDQHWLTDKKLKKGSDVKIFCEDKTYECHKIILSLQSEVFERMLDSNMAESKSGEIKIKGTSATTLEAILNFLYNENLDKNEITGDLLIAADFYMIQDLVTLCLQHLKANLTDQNATEVMISAYKTNQKELFRLACSYVAKKMVEGLTLKKEALEKMKEEDPELAIEMMSEAMFNCKL